MIVKGYNEGGSQKRTGTHTKKNNEEDHKNIDDNYDDNNIIQAGSSNNYDPKDTMKQTKQK